MVLIVQEFYKISPGCFKSLGHRFKRILRKPYFLQEGWWLSAPLNKYEACFPAVYDHSSKHTPSLRTHHYESYRIKKYAGS